MSIKFLVLGGGGYFGFFFWGGSADFIFMGAWIFLTFPFLPSWPWPLLNPVGPILNAGSLVTRPKYPPISRNRCSITPVALCFLWYRRLSLLHPTTSFFEEGLSQSKDRANKGVSQKKLAYEAYRAIGGVARNSTANRAIVGH